MTNIRFHQFRPLGPFTAIEYEPVVDAGDHIYVSDNPDEFSYWSVYVRYHPDTAKNFGGVDCVADVDTREQAVDLAALLEILLF